MVAGGGGGFPPMHKYVYYKSKSSFYDKSKPCGGKLLLREQGQLPLRERARRQASSTRVSTAAAAAASFYFYFECTIQSYSASKSTV